MVYLFPMKLRKYKYPFLAGAVVVLLISISFAPPAEKYFDIAKNLDIFTTLFKEVNAYYVDEVQPKALIDKGIAGMLESLDPYTNYISEEDIESFSILTTGQYAGIGALIGNVRGQTMITNLYEGFPAIKAGLKVGDVILSIDGVSIGDKTTSETSSLLKGKPKTEVKLNIRRAEKDFTVNITRDKIKLPNVSFKGMLGEEVGYIRLDDFTPGAAKEVEGALVELKKLGAKKWILDLRDNPGGLLHEAVNMVNIFVPKGMEVVSTKGKVKEWNKTYYTLNKPADMTSPLVVLTSAGSASAAEIVAGSLQDYDRAILIGQQTFGKGLVQTTRELAYNAQLKVTTARYYIPSGRCIQALDYSHRNLDGSVDKVADSLIAEFSTKAGRKVYDGGGLKPDVVVKQEPLSPAIVQLISSGLIFEYATLYSSTHTRPPQIKQLSISEADYIAFIEWLKERNFVYSSELEKQMDQLITLAEKERSNKEIRRELDFLQAKIKESRATDLLRFKNEVSAILEEEIAFHYGLVKDQIEIALDRDKEIKEALKYLGDEVAYKKLLSPE